MEGIRTKEQLTQLVGGAIRGTADQRERVVARILAGQEAGRRVGYETSVWHEAALEFGTKCHCRKCDAA